jgi:Ca-activated chloride channel family protein
MPRTALGWYQQLLFGLLIMLLAPLILRMWAK